MPISPLDFSRSLKLTKYISELEKSQWWPREKILELQNERLRKLVKHAYENVPYYRRLFDERSLKPEDINSSADLAKLPILDKKLIRENFNDLLARNFPRSEMVLSRTGGSTGEPLLFYTTRDEQRNWDIAKRRRVEGWWGYKIGEGCAVLIKTPRLSLAERARLFLERHIYLGVERMADELPLFLKKLYHFQPQLIVGYPSALYLLARFIAKFGKPKFKPKAVVTVSEQLYDFQKELLEEVFGCHIFRHYAAWETRQVGAECPEHSGYHIAAESIVVEVVDNRGINVPVGEEGRIVVTNLNNYAMPFLRYDLGDVGALSSKDCPCGRGLPLLSKLSGRTTDFIITKDGRRIPGMAIDFRPLASEGVEQFRFVQESYDGIVIKLVLPEDYPSQSRDELAGRVSSFYKSLFGGMEISVEFPSELPLTREGKRRVVVSKLPSDF